MAHGPLRVAQGDNRPPACLPQSTLAPASESRIFMHYAEANDRPGLLRRARHLLLRAPAGRGRLDACTPSTWTPAAPAPAIAPRSGDRPRRSGAVAHHEVDARERVYQRFVRFLIQGNVLRGEVYPLSVAAERTQQALSVVEVARADRGGGRGPRLHRRGQRPGAVRRRPAGARARARDRDADSRRRASGGSRPSPTSRRAACRFPPGPGATASTAASGAPPGAAGGPTTPGPALRPS